MAPSWRCLALTWRAGGGPSAPAIWRVRPLPAERALVACSSCAAACWWPDPCGGADSGLLGRAVRRTGLGALLPRLGSPTEPVASPLRRPGGSLGLVLFVTASASAPVRPSSGGSHARQGLADSRADRRGRGAGDDAWPRWPDAGRAGGGDFCRSADQHAGLAAAMESVSALGRSSGRRASGARWPPTSRRLRNRLPLRRGGRRLFVQLLPRLLGSDLQRLGEAASEGKDKGRRSWRVLVEVANPAVFGRTSPRCRWSRFLCQISRLLQATSSCDPQRLPARVGPARAADRARVPHRERDRLPGSRTTARRSWTPSTSA